MSTMAKTIYIEYLNPKFINDFQLKSKNTFIALARIALFQNSLPHFREKQANTICKLLNTEVQNI